MRKILVVGGLVAVLAVGFGSPASAGSIGVVPSGGCLTSSAGALFCDNDDQPTGTGIFDPFMRVFRDGTHNDGTPNTYSSGWNTDNNDMPESNDAPAVWNHALALSDLATIIIDGQSYYRFTADINQQGKPGSDNSLLDLVNFELFNCGTSNYQLLTETCNGGTPFFDAFGPNEWVTIDYHSLIGDSGGSGDGELDVYVPIANFVGPFIALHDGWGGPPATNFDNDGYQEWRAMVGGSTISTISTINTNDVDITDQTINTNNVNVTPEPATLMLFGSGLAIAASRLRRRKKI